MKIQTYQMLLWLSHWHISGFANGSFSFVERTRNEFFPSEKGLNRVRSVVQALFKPFLLITFFCFATQLSAQQFYLEDLPPEVNLSSNKVNCILQDSQGFLWIGTANGLNRFDGYSIKIFKNKIGNPNSLSNNVVQDVIEDHEGILWIATDGGLNKLNPRTQDFQHFRHASNDPNSINNNRVRAIYEDEHHNLWVGTVDGLNKLDRSTTQFTRYLHPFSRMHPWDDVQDIRQIEGYMIQNKSFLILAYWGSGAMKFNIETTEFSRIERVDVKPRILEWPYIHVSDEKELYVVDEQSVFKYSDKSQGLEFIEIKEIERYNSLNLESIYKHQNTLLLGTTDGRLLQIDSEENFLLQETINIQNKASIKAIAKGLDNEIWIGTIPEGIKKLDLDRNTFRNYQYHLEPNHFNINSDVSSIVETKPNTFLLGTYTNGLFQFDLLKRQFTTPFELDLKNKNNPKTPVRTLLKDSKNQVLLGGYFDGGIAYLDERTNTIAILSEDYKIDDAKVNFVNTIHETSAEELWIGTYEGILVLDIDSLFEPAHQGHIYIENQQFKSSLSHSDITTIQEDHRKRIWVGTEAGGVNRWSENTKQFTHFRHDIYNPNSISSDNIVNIFEDRQQRLWISTLNGLNLWKETTQSFSHFTEFPALHEEVILSFKEDQHGDLWMTTQQSLIRFNPERKTLLRFDEQDGLLNNKFHHNAFAESSASGHFLIGGKNGITVFHPDSIRKNDFIPSVYITELRRYETEDKEIIEQGMSWREDITLSYKNTILTFEFTALNYRNSKKNQYAYQLEGFNDNWIDIGTKREVTFTNLPPGEYRLNVKGANNDGVWNENPTSLQIIITPPWWKTEIAYIIYGLLFLGLLYLIYRFLLYRQSLNYQLQTEQAEAQRLKELDSFKSRLYTNLTHEFRTPLTVILGMTQQIRSEPKQFLDSGTQLIERNGKNLLRLINQLLDLSKLDDKSFQLHLQQADIVAYLRYLTESFQTYANSENLSLQFLSTLEDLQMDYDPEQVQQIMTNLISNAVKYTPSGGSIKVKLKQVEQQLQLEIHDTGIGITAVDLPHIFDRFYQLDDSTTRKEEGTGIGLAHTRELVQLMGGEIKAESRIDKGSIFSILLPITNNALIKEPELNASNLAVQLPIDENDSLVDTNQLPQLLIIEDNPDVVIYLKACLINQYQIDVAYNGKVGIVKAIEQIPDLIISDVMMPEKDGYEVCNTLKNDERSSHIPIILLTAKADVNSKITGLRRGADAYLIKPFDKEELLIRLEMMIEKQQKLAAYFSQGAISMDAAIEEDIQIEHEFVQKVRSIIEKNYTNDRFGLSQLCQKVGMSRSQLYRKMKALIDTSPSDFIRTYRLQQAKKLLETTELNVSEVAWEVGFTSLPHFSKIFQEEFGFTPNTTNK